MTRTSDVLKRDSAGVLTEVASIGSDASGEYPPRCFIGKIRELFVIRSGLIDTEAKAGRLIALAKDELKKRKKLAGLIICFAQAQSVENEWGECDSQHQALTCLAGSGENAVILHVVTPLESLVFSQPPLAKVASYEKTLHDLYCLMNMEAWITYCSLYDKMLEKVFARFSYDATDEYTLENYLKLFHHEVHSYYLKDTLESLRNAEAARCVPEGSFTYKQQVSQEKELLLLRSDLRRMAKAHYDNLYEIVRLVKAVEHKHPELIPLKSVGELLLLAMGDEVDPLLERRPSWSSKQMALQLLNDQLGIVSAVNSGQGQGRTHIAFSIRLALLQMQQSIAFPSVWEMALHWDNEEATPTQQSVRQKFRQLFYENLIHFCVPIAEANRREVALTWKEEFVENRKILSLLPRKNPHNQDEVLVEYDREGRKPSHLAAAGRRLLLNLAVDI